MKKLFLLFAFLLGLGVNIQAQEETPSPGRLKKEVTLTQANTLAIALGDQVAKVTELVVKGPLDREDFKTMNKQMNMLQVLDMSGVTSLSSDEGINSIPSEAFYNKKTLQKVIFPKLLISINNSAFSGCTNLESIVFQTDNKLESIGGHAFYNCTKLRFLDLSNSKQLKYFYNFNCFANCSNLENVNLSGCINLEEIGQKCFEGCSSLQIVDLSKCCNLKIIKDDAFSSCVNLTSIELKENSKLETLEDNVFYGSKLSTFKFSELAALSSIGNGAFSGTNLSGNVVFASSIRHIGVGAFQNCNITSFDFTKCTVLSVISERAFAECAYLSKVDFSNCSSLNTLSLSAFWRCPSLESVKIDNGFFTTIDDVLYLVDKTTLLFYPSGKKDVKYVIPSFVKNIGNCAFAYNESLLDITIPSTVKTIEPWAFATAEYGSGPHWKITMENPEPILLNQSIGLDNKFVYVPKGAGAAYRNAPIWKDSKILESGVETINIELQVAGSLDAKLEEKKVDLSIIQNLKISGPMNDKDCSLFKQMYLLSKVDLSGVTFENNKLPDGIFSKENPGSGRNWFECLSEIVLPSNIKTIGREAFLMLDPLQKLNIPTSVEVIESNAFGSCTNLSKIDLSTLTQLRRIEGSFSYSSLIEESLKLPSSLEFIGGWSFNGTGVTSVDFSNTSITEIGDCAFGDCPITGTLSFPPTLQRIGSKAFEESNVSSIILRSPQVVRLADVSVFRSINKEECVIKVPKGLAAAYKNDPYWSLFKKIEEFGVAITAISNNENYGIVSVSGNNIEGNKIILKAECKEKHWASNSDKYVFFFDGWYDKDTNKKISSDKIYQYVVENKDKSFEGRFFKYTFKVDSKYGYGSINLIDLKDRSLAVEFIKEADSESRFLGWYENATLISNDKMLTLKIDDIGGNKDRCFVAKIDRFFNPIEGNEILTDANKIDGQDVFFYKGSLTVEGEKIWKPGHFIFRRGSSLLVNSEIEPTKISYEWDFFGESNNHWYFFSLPYPIKVDQIQVENGQFVVREYDGKNRADLGVGNSWKQLKSTDLLEVNKGYIVKMSNHTNITFNAPTGMNALFNRSAVEIPLATYASSSAMDANWNFIGNPYPCYYKVSQLFADGLDAMVTVWSQDLQNYEYYSADDVDAYLQPLTAFFVQKNQKNIVFKPEGRVASISNPNEPRSTLRADDGRTIINLVLTNDSLSDRSRIVFNEAASNNYELGKDAAKFYSPNTNVPMLYSLEKDNKPLAINERPLGNGIVRLGYTAGVKGTYTIQLKEAVNADLTLEDLKTGAICDLSEGAYTFDSEAGEFGDRFELRSGNPTSNTEVEYSLKCYVSEGKLVVSGLTSQTTITVVNALGQVVYQGNVTEGSNFITLPGKGIYYISLVGTDGQQTVRSIKW